jgi:hypothetical protein
MGIPLRRRKLATNEAWYVHKEKWRLRDIKTGNVDAWPVPGDYIFVDKTLWRQQELEMELDGLHVRLRNNAMWKVGQL